MGMVREEISRTPQGRSIELVRLTQGPVTLLLLGGVHGDEREGYVLVERFVREGDWRGLEGKASLYVVPRVNPDGCALNTRGNAHGVDLNRNMATKDWDPVAHNERYQPGPSANSELETRALEALVLRLKPALIVSAHSAKEICVNFNGPAEAFAQEMARHNGLPVTNDIGYPTPGSLGTWAGWERKIPTLTLEIFRGSDDESIWKTHGKAVAKVLEFAAAGGKK